MLIIKKFGGSYIRDKEHMMHVAQSVIKDYQAGHDLVLVLSAKSKATDQLIAMAKEVNTNPSKREMDMLLATGEQTAAALMAMSFGALGISAVSLNAFQVAMYTSHKYGNARLKRVGTERIMNELDERKIVIVTGFQGIDQYENITTLGRGGSDTTAVALAAALHADRCEIFTDVKGVYTGDPRIVKNARKIPEITYDEMLELATLGANILQNRAVEMARKYGVQIIVKSDLEDETGTVVKEVVSMEKMLVSGVAVDKNTARISLSGVKDKPGVAFHLFNALAKNNINVDMILQSTGNQGKKEIAFTVAENMAEEAVKVIKKCFFQDDYDKIDTEKSVVKISIVGAGLVSNAGVAASMFEALYDVGVNIKMISTSEIRMTVLVDEKDTECAANAIHDKFSFQYA